MDIIDRNYGTNVEKLLEDAKANPKDDSLYLAVGGGLGIYAAGVSYLSGEGVLAAAKAPLAEDEANALISDVESKAGAMGLSVYQGAVARSGDTLVRVHGGGLNDLADVEGGYLEKLQRDQAAGEFSYMVQDTLFFGDVLVGSVKAGDSLYVVSGFATKEAADGFLGRVKAAGYTVREGLDQSAVDALEALQKAQGQGPAE
jgi:hypothetical protein